MKFAGINVPFLSLFAAISSLSSAYPLTKRADVTFNVNPLLLNVPFPTITPSQQSFTVGTTNVATLSDAITEACTQHATALQQQLAGCQVDPVAQCNRLNDVPINSQDLANENDQCIARQLNQNSDGTLSVSDSIFNIPIQQITQTGNLFTVGSKSFYNISDALTEACNVQKTQTLTKLNTCQTNPTADCTPSNGQPVTTDLINKQNDACAARTVQQV